jgi:tol-pal system protein YbgF
VRPLRALPSLLRGSALAALLAAALPAHALFEDDEARKAILDLRAKVEQQRTEQAEQARQQSEVIAQLRRSLLELNATIEQLRTEIARLRGQDEQLAREVAELQRRQKDVATGVEERIRKLEPQPVTMDGKEFLADPEEKRQFEEAMTAFRGGDFDRAIGAFGTFLRRYPASGYEESGLFWLGNAQYAKRDYKAAIPTFRALVTKGPAHPKAPEALLAIANCQIELKDRPGARKTLDELIKAYPNSEAALAGRERLVAIRG